MRHGRGCGCALAGLARATVAAPRRRIDLALPEDVPVAEILPGLLAHAGEELADEGVGHGGWMLRRPDGTPLGHTRTLSSHRVRDGEVLHLVPRRVEWPELDYDDLVDAIATGSRRRAARWSRRHTRQAGLAVGCAAVLLALAAVAGSGPDWGPAARWLLGQAALLLVAGIVLSRVAGDSGAGAVVGLLALPYAVAGGALAQAGDRPLTALEAPQVLLAAALLLCAGLVGYAAIADATWLFAGGICVGLLGVVGALLSGTWHLPAYQVAAVLVGLLLPFSPAFPSLAIRLGRVPLPALPTSTADLVRDEPQPPRPAVYTAVARADALLTGMLLGAAVVSAAGLVLLVRSDSAAGRLLALVATVGFLLRSRLYPIIRQRVPLLLAGLTGLTALLLGLGLARPGGQLTAAGSGLLALGGAAIACGLVYSRRAPSPYLGRSAEIFELLVILSVLPLACSVLGLYGRLRGLGS